MEKLNKIFSRLPRFFALSAADGSELWHFDAGDSLSGANVVGGVVFLSGQDSKVYALEAADGTEKEAELMRRASAAVKALMQALEAPGKGD